ncbi:hypothetical protein Hanom_Chr12g01139981 [Helianthus anomalus]
MFVLICFFYFILGQFQILCLCMFSLNAFFFGFFFICILFFVVFGCNDGSQHQVVLVERNTNETSKGIWKIDKACRVWTVEKEWKI